MLLDCCGGGAAAATAGAAVAVIIVVVIAVMLCYFIGAAILLRLLFVPCTHKNFIDNTIVKKAPLIRCVCVCLRFYI